MQYSSGSSTASSPVKLFTPVITGTTTSTPIVIDLRITTPNFYVLIACAIDPAQFLFSALQNQDPKTQIVQVSHPKLLLLLFQACSICDSSALPSSSPRYRSRILLLLLNLLRRRFSTMNQPEHTFSQLLKVNSILDHFVCYHLPPDQLEEYQKTVVKLLISDTLFFGLPSLVDALYLIMRSFLCYLYARWIYQATVNVLKLWATKLIGIFA